MSCTDLETLSALHPVVRELKAERDQLADIVEALEDFLELSAEAAAAGDDPKAAPGALAAHARLTRLVDAHMHGEPDDGN